MSKITRYQGNLRAFASNAKGMERTLFGEPNQADDLTSQITEAFLRGWGIVGASEHPTIEDFNAAMYAMSQFIAYQHQVGVAEWHREQEYYIGSVCTYDGEPYLSLTDDNAGNEPSLSKEWVPILTAENGFDYLGLGSAAKKNTGTSGDTVPLLNTANTWAAKQTFSGGLTGELSGNAATATKLQTARKIGGVAFDGTADISLPGVNKAGNQGTTGNAATATKLQTARKIGGVAFDGTKDISLPGVNAAGNQSTTGNAATATKLQTARKIGGVAFDGTTDISLPGVNKAGNQATTGNAATATKLQTARKIAGIAFDGTKDIAAGDLLKNLGLGGVGYALIDAGSPALNSRIVFANPFGNSVPVFCFAEIYHATLKKWISTPWIVPDAGPAGINALYSEGEGIVLRVGKSAFVSYTTYSGTSQEIATAYSTVSPVRVHVFRIS